jgi:hypothetical protein
VMDLNRSKVLIPGSWLLDPLLQSKYSKNWVKIWSDLVSEDTLKAVFILLNNGKDPLNEVPNWRRIPALVTDFDNRKKLYGVMNVADRSSTLLDLENFTGIEIFYGNLTL